MKPIGRREFLKGTGVGLAALLAAPDLAFSRSGPWAIPCGNTPTGGGRISTGKSGPGTGSSTQLTAWGAWANALGRSTPRTEFRSGRNRRQPIPSTPGTRPASTLGNAMERIAGSISGMVPAGSSFLFAPGLPERDHLLRLHEAGKLPQVPAQESGRARGEEVEENLLGEGL